MAPTERSATVARLLALLLALALVAAACGDSDGEGAAEGDGDGGGGTDQPEGPEPADDGEPVAGGTLVYGVEADTANPWAPYRASYATSGYVVLNTIADPLFTVNRDLEFVPYLLESFEPNDDYTVWTFTVRDGITFHDGTPLDAEAVKINIESCAGSPLAGPAYANIGTVEADGMTVTITTATTPWVAMPAYFSGGACSFMFSPQWLTSLDDLPQKTEGNRFYDPEIAAMPGGGDPAAPVGTGPFVFQSYVPGNGNPFIATRNEDYWRGPNGITGEQLPYLDAVEIVPAVDIDSRSNALQSGQFDVIHTANSDEISRYLDDDAFETVTSNEYGETSHIMINNAQGVNLMTGQELDPNGANADNPLTTLACRRALAHALDSERFVEEREGGLPEPANGPFPPGSIGYLEDSGYPEYDLDAAQEQMDACLAERGTDRIAFAFNTTNDPFNVESNQLAISMWEEAFGDQIDVTITPIEQGQYIGLGLTGDFDALGWRNFSGIDPDQQLLWWISATAAPIGELALNFGRFSDPVIDESLLTIRTNPDPAARQAAAEAINRRFGEQVYNWWYYWTVWGVISEPHVNNLVPAEALDGSELLTMVGARHPMAQIWCEGGVCE